MDSIQAQQLNQALQNTHNSNLGGSLVCNTSTVEALTVYLPQQGSAVPVELLNSDGTAALANNMISNMESSNNFLPISVNQAMELANNGAVVIAGQTGDSHGHVDVVGSGGTQSTGRAAFINQNPKAIGNSSSALKGDWVSRGKMSYSFSSQPTYYHYTGFTPRPNAMVMQPIRIILPAVVNLSTIKPLVAGR